MCRPGETLSLHCKRPRAISQDQADSSRPEACSTVGEGCGSTPGRLCGPIGFDKTRSSYGARCHLVYRLDLCDTRVALGLSWGQQYPWRKFRVLVWRSLRWCFIGLRILNSDSACVKICREPTWLAWRVHSERGRKPIFALVSKFFVLWAAGWVS